MWNNTVHPDRPQMTIWHMLIACWIPKATNTGSEYVILTVFYCNNGCKNAPHFYVIFTLPLLFTVVDIDVVVNMSTWKCNSCSS